jgi:hypothetical protein
MLTVKVLFLAANPLDSDALQLDLEIREILEKVRASAGRDQLEVISRWAVRPDDLLQHLNEQQPHIVHFSGHGSRSKGIVLEDEHRRATPVRKDALIRLFRTLSDNIRIVVLNTCFSEEQAKAITEVIDCAIGTPREIDDAAAVAFAASFYRAIGFGRSVKEAFEQGLVSLDLSNVPEAHMPRLLVGAGVDASNIILVGDRTSMSRPLNITRDDLSTDRFYEREDK